MRVSSAFIIFILILPVCTAQTLESNTHDFNIVYDRVLVESELVFDVSQQVNFELDLPEDYSGLSLYVNDDLKEPVIENNKLKLLYDSVKKIKFDYLTDELLDKDIFLANIVVPFDTGDFRITVTLPEEAVLEKPLGNGISGSIYPKPNKAITDGKSLIFEWDKHNITKGDDQAIFIQYRTKADYGFLLWSFALIIIGLLMYIISRKPKVETVVHKEDLVEKHLKEDEEQILNILKSRDGQSEQGTLRVITGFSKATLSRLLKELEERNVVYKEKRGKKNLVFLKK